MYILLYRSEDEPSYRVFKSKAELLKELEELNIPLENFEDDIEDGDIGATEFPSDTAYLIKGELILPKTKSIDVD